MSKASSSKLLQLGSVLYTGKAIKSGAHVTLTPVLLTKTSLQARRYSKRYQRMTKRRGAGADSVDDKEFAEMKEEEEKEQAKKREEGDERQVEEKEEEEVSDEQLMQEKWDITKMPEEEVRAMWDPEGDVISKRMEVILKRQKRAGDIYDNNPLLYGTGVARVEAANEMTEEELNVLNEEEDVEDNEGVEEDEEANEEEEEQEEEEEEEHEEAEEEGAEEDEDIELPPRMDDVEPNFRLPTKEEAGNFFLADVETNSLLAKRLAILDEVNSTEFETAFQGGEENTGEAAEYDEKGALEEQEEEGAAEEFEEGAVEEFEEGAEEGAEEFEEGAVEEGAEEDAEEGAEEFEEGAIEEGAEEGAVEEGAVEEGAVEEGAEFGETGEAGEAGVEEFEGLDEMNEMNEMDEMHELHELNEFEALNEMNEMERLDGLEGLEELEEFEEYEEYEEESALLKSLKALGAQHGVPEPTQEDLDAETEELQKTMDVMAEEDHEDDEFALIETEPVVQEEDEEADMEEDEDLESAMVSSYRARNPVDPTGFLSPEETLYAARYASEAGLVVEATEEQAGEMVKELQSGSGEVPAEVEAILARDTEPQQAPLDPSNIEQLREWADKIEEDALNAEETEASAEEQKSTKGTGVAAQVLEFERQLGMTPELLEKEEQERQRLSGKLLNLENNPVFTQVPQPPFKNAEEDAYRAFLAKRGQSFIDHNLLDYDPSLVFQTFAKGQELPSYPPGAGIRDEKERLKSIGADFAAISAAQSPLPEFTLEEKMQLFGEAQEFRSEKYVDQPNREYTHLFSSQAPERIELEDARKMYIISQNDHASYFQGGFGGSLDSVFESLNQRSLMIRYQVLPVIEHLKKVRAHVLQQKPLEENKRGFIFTGVRGGGKSSLLTVATHYAFKNDFLVFYIPNGFWWTNGKHYVEPSTLIRGYFHCPMAEERFMKAFQSANTAFLQNHPLSKDYDLPLETGQKQPRTLFDLINYGLAQYTNRTIAFKLLMDEIALIKHVPMLFAIDDYNFLTDETAFSFGDIKNFQTVMPKKVHADKLILMRGLNKILHENSSNVVFLCAEAKKWPAKTPRTLDSYTLFDIVNVPRYTAQEMKTICDYYTSVYWSFSRPDTYIDSLTFITGAVGERVWKSMQIF